MGGMSIITNKPGAFEILRSTSLLLFCISQLEITKGDARTAPIHVSQTNNRSRIANKLQLSIRRNGRGEIPGLYDEYYGIMTPIQGQDQFNQLVLGLATPENDSLLGNCSSQYIEKAASNQTISLVQYYMATCPDCQGFSPYFKRFAFDIGPLWRQLVRLYTVNCNDFQNIHLCQEQNPKLIVPMVRWYHMPIIQRDSRMKQCNLATKTDMLSIAHRQFIDEQRRDLISLRHATLRFISLTVDELLSAGDKDANLTLVSNRHKLFDSLPIHWHLSERLDRDLSKGLSLKEQFYRGISNRNSLCRDRMGSNSKLIEHFIIFENIRSFIGRTIIADWSSFSCDSNDSKPVVLIHRFSDFKLLNDLNVSGMPQDIESREPMLLHLNSSENRLKFIASKKKSVQTRTIRARRNAFQTSRLERIQQRASLERYYSHLSSSIDKHPIRYAAAMTATIGDRNRSSLQKRDTSTGSSNKTATYENANWTPESAYPEEEYLRYNFNRLIATKLNLTNDSVPGSLLAGLHPGKIETDFGKTGMNIIDPVQDDLSLMYLTDYYKALHEIVHVDLVAKAEVDGYQLLASCYFLRDLKRHFPFQGNAHGSSQIGSKSVARYYMEMLQKFWTRELTDRASNETISNHSLSSDKRLANPLNLKDISVPSSRLTAIQADLMKTYDVGLPASKHLKWNYCAGSSTYLRGHTCSLWVLFHTLTVHEYLQSVDDSLEDVRIEEPIEYKFQINYSKPPRRACNPANPDNAYLSAGTEELFVNATDYALANIINFVRFYLPCTNCAAHFSCMVEHSPGLHFPTKSADGRSTKHRLHHPDSHLLWLWEGHNRVNERTRSTHSEDPTRPKHIFPQYGACPECYIEQPEANATLTSMRFNRHELVKFIAARYRKSGILNNKVNIEDLYKKA